MWWEQMFSCHMISGVAHEYQAIFIYMSEKVENEKVMVESR